MDATLGAFKIFVYEPDRLRQPAPLVVVFHRCAQTAGGRFVDPENAPDLMEQGAAVRGIDREVDAEETTAHYRHTVYRDA